MFSLQAVQHSKSMYIKKLLSFQVSFFHGQDKDNRLLEMGVMFPKMWGGEFKIVLLSFVLFIEEIFQNILQNNTWDYFGMALGVLT